MSATDDFEAAVGLRRGTVRVDHYTELWAEEFERERQRLDTRLGARLLAIEHIGSTSVPGLPSKPLIDMQAAVESLDRVDDILNRPGMSGELIRWKDHSHGTTQQVPDRAA